MENNEVSLNILYIVFIFVTISIIYLYMKGENIKIVVDRKKKKMCRKKGSRNQRKRSSRCRKKKSSRKYKKISSRRYKKRSYRNKKKCSCKEKNCIHKRKRSPKNLNKILKKVNTNFRTEINSNHLINQHVVPYINKDINQEFSVGKDLYANVSDFHVPLNFLDVDYDKANYSNTRIYHFGDVVTVKDPKSGELQDYVNLVSDLTGIIGQNPLKDKIAWLKIKINRLNGTSKTKIL